MMQKNNSQTFDEHLESLHSSQWWPELLHAEELLAAQDSDGVERLLNNLKVAFKAGKVTDLSSLTMIEVLRLECNALLGLDVSSELVRLKGTLQTVESPSLQNRLQVIEAMYLVTLRNFRQLEELVLQDVVDPLLYSLMQSLAVQGRFDADIALGLQSPLSRTMFHHCMLSNELDSMASGSAMNLDNMARIEDTLGAMLPPSSIIPVTVWRIKQMSKGAKWLKGRIIRDLGGLSFPVQSYGRMFANVSDAIQLTKDKDFKAAERIFMSVHDASGFDRGLALEIYKSRIICKLGTNKIDRALSMLYDLLGTEASQSSAAIWTADEAIDIVKVFLANVEYSETSLDVLQLLVPKLMVVYGDGSFIVQKARIRMALIAMEIGQINTCASLLSTYGSAKGVRAYVPDPSDLCVIEALSKFLNGLNMWNYNFEILGSDRIGSGRQLPPDQDLGSHYSFADLIHGNELHATIFGVGDSTLIVRRSEALNNSFLSGARKELLGALTAYLKNPSDELFHVLRSKTERIEPRFILGLTDYMLEVSLIASGRNMPQLCSAIEKKLIEATVKQDSKVRNALLTHLALAAEARKEYRHAAVMFDKLIRENIHWISSTESLQSYVLYRSAYCWSMNFNHDKADHRARECVRTLEDSLDSLERFALFDLAARCSEHLGNNPDALENLQEAASMLDTTEITAARRFAQVSLRIGRCAEALESLEVAHQAYSAGIEILSAFVDGHDDDLIALKNRQYFVGISLNISNVTNGTFYVNKRTFDSPS